MVIPDHENELDNLTEVLFFLGSSELSQTDGKVYLGRVLLEEKYTYGFRE